MVGPAFAIAAPFSRATRLHRPATFADVPAPAEPAPDEAVIDPGRGELLMSVGATSDGAGQADSGIYGYERALKRVGLDPVAGADEAGRGACAGPLVAAAAILSDAKSRQIERPARTPSC